MTHAARVLRKGVRRVLWWQTGVAIPVGVVSVFLGPHQGGLARFLAALAGASIAMLGTFVLAYTIGRTDDKASPAQAQLWLYGGAVARFFLAIILLGLGLGVFRLSPLPFLIAFALGQMAYLAPGISSEL